MTPTTTRWRWTGKRSAPKKLIYVALNKPPGCVCSRKDELNRPTIYDLLPREWETVQSVGRLDYNSEGLIFLTNDGQFALRLTHPRYGVRKKYLATVEGEVTPAMLELFKQRHFSRGRKIEGARGEDCFRHAAPRAWWNWNWAKAKTARCGGCLSRRCSR